MQGSRRWIMGLALLLGVAICAIFSGAAQADSGWSGTVTRTYMINQSGDPSLIGSSHYTATFGETGGHATADERITTTSENVGNCAPNVSTLQADGSGDIGAAGVDINPLESGGYHYVLATYGVQLIGTFRNTNTPCAVEKGDYTTTIGVGNSVQPEAEGTTTDPNTIADSLTTHPNGPSTTVTVTWNLTRSNDPDHDGFPDTGPNATDKCPGVSGGPGSTDGCVPDGDRDDDGFPDTTDACPGVPGGPGSTNGCPKKACADGVDNDGDGSADYAGDLGCLSPDANSESGEQPGLKWSMPERFDGRDHTGDKLVEYFTGTRSYDFSPGLAKAPAPQIDSNVWRVDLQAGAPCRQVPGITWVIDGTYNAGSVGCSATYYFPSSAALKTKSPVKHQVDFRVNGRTKTTFYVTPKDYLIASIGDSYASGEGVPDIPWFKGSEAGIPPRPSAWEDKQCHRSAGAATALAAADVERADTHSSVTFIHLACSGGKGPKGIYGPYNGAAPDANKKKPESAQLSKLKTLVGRRTPDAVLLSLGGNDIGFGDIIKGCAKYKKCDEPKVEVEKGKKGKKDKKTDNPALAFSKAIKKLPSVYTKVADGVKATSKSKAVPGLKSIVPASRVVITEYPDSTRYDNGKICGTKPSEQLLSDNPVVGKYSVAKITVSEAKWASDTVLKELNGAVANTKNKKIGWTPVSSHLKSFLKHGYCAKNNWIVRFKEALELQEAIPTKKLPDAAPGTFHPNPAGQQAYKKAIRAQLQKLGMP